MSNNTPDVVISPEEIAKVIALEKIKNDYNKKESEEEEKKREQLERIAQQKEKAAQKRAELNRIVGEEEAIEIITSFKYKTMSFLILYGVLLSISLVAILYLNGYNINDINLLYQTIVENASNKNYSLLYQIFIPSICIILFFYVFMVFISKVITKIFEGKDDSFFGLFFKKYANIYNITNEKILKEIKPKIGTPTGKKSYFLDKVTYWYALSVMNNMFLGKNPYKTKGKITSIDKKYEDENTKIIDSLIINKGIYVARYDISTQGRDDKGQFTQKEEQKEYMKIYSHKEVSNGFEYKYIIPMGYNSDNLISSELGYIFKQEFKKINKNLTIKISNDSKYFVFKIIDGNIEKKTISLFQYYLGINKRILPELLSDSLEVPIGLDFSGEIVKIPSLEKTPHILIAGGTASGKSVSYGSVMVGYLLLNSPMDLSFVILDPHKSSISMGLKDSYYNYFKGKIFDKEDFLPLLKVLEEELDYRRRLIGDIEGINTLSELNSIALSLKIKKIKRLIVSIDEFSSSYSGLTKQEENEAKNILGRIGKEGRKYGIHILAIEQNPIATSFPLDLKKQMGTRICMRVNSVSESNTVLGRAILDETANNIKTKGVALVNFEGSFEGKMKFFVVPQMDKTIKVDNDFGIKSDISIKDLIRAIEYQIHNISGLEEEILSSNRVNEDIISRLDLDGDNISNLENNEDLSTDIIGIKEDVLNYKEQYTNLSESDILFLIIASGDGLSRNSWNDNFSFISEMTISKFRRDLRTFTENYGDFFEVGINQKKILKYTLQETLNSLNIIKNESN